MILEHDEIESRLNHPENLFNRLRKLTEIPSVPNGIQILDKDVNHPGMPGIDDIVENVEDKVNTAKTFSRAKQVLANTLERLDERLTEVDRPVDLCRIAEGMGKLINGFDDNKKGDLSKAPVIIWKPVMNSEVHYGDVIQSEL